MKQSPIGRSFVERKCCAHVWTPAAAIALHPFRYEERVHGIARAAGDAADVCPRCGSTCERDERGTIIEYFRGALDGPPPRERSDRALAEAAAC